MSSTPEVTVTGRDHHAHKVSVETEAGSRTIRIETLDREAGLPDYREVASLIVDSNNMVSLDISRSPADGHVVRDTDAMAVEGSVVDATLAQQVRQATAGISTKMSPLEAAHVLEIYNTVSAKVPTTYTR